jgi:hypothetical protein
MFKYDGGYITNIGYDFNKKQISGRKVTVKDAKDAEAQQVIATGLYRGRNPAQIWRVVYTDAMGSEAIRKKGEKSKDGTGFIVDEPFYFRSRLPMQRVVECVGASNATLKKWAKGRKAQQWRFNPITKTINGMYWTSYVLNMEGNYLRCRSTTSKWT